MAIPGVPYSMPLRTAASAAPDLGLLSADALGATDAFHDATDAAAAVAKAVRVRGSAWDGDDTPRSGLVFEGAAAVHGLFNLLYGTRRDTERRLPDLLSPSPFLNAALRSGQVPYSRARQHDGAAIAWHP